MSTDSLCFVHAADLHLEQSLFGIAEIPPALRNILMDAPYIAAGRVFDTAIDQQADFLLLTGDVLDPAQCGPRAIAFLFQQFEKLDEAGIAVYWLGGKVDSADRWERSLVLPSNVFVIGEQTGDSRTHDRDGHPVAWIGRSHPSVSPPHDRFSIIVGYEPNEPPSFEHQNVDFVALGGQHCHHVVAQSPMVQYAGSPQGRCPGEAGAHGCAVVRFHASGDVRTHRVETDAVRWHTEHVNVASDVSHGELESQLGDRMLNLLSESADRPMLISWKIEGAAQLQDRDNATELLAWLRNEFADNDPCAWSVSLTADPPGDWPESWYEEDTILGDYLRAVRELQNSDEDALELDEVSPHHDSEVASVLSAANQQEQVLQSAAALGVQLLRGQES